MNILKKTFYVLTILSLATLFSGCSSKQKTETTKKVFTIWSFEDEDIWKPIITQMGKKELKGYEIKYIKKTLTDTYENDALNSIMTGEGPDIWAIPNSWVYRHKDKLVAMPDALIKSTKMDIDAKFVPTVKESCYFDNKLYGLSPTVDTMMLYYNQKLFEEANSDFRAANKVNYLESKEIQEAKTQLLQQTNKLLSNPPNTWNDMVRINKLITKKNGNDITRSGISLGDPSNVRYSTDIVYALMMQNGTKLLSDDLKLATLNLPQNTAASSNDYPAKRALEFFTSFSDPSSENYSWNATMPKNLDSFGDGKTAMIIAPGSAANYFNQKFPSLQYRTAPFPQIGTNNEEVTDYGVFTAFVTPKLSPTRDIAWSIIYKISSGEYSFDTSIKLGSSLKKYSDPITVKDRGGASPLNFQSQTAHTWIKGRYPVETDNYLASAISEVANKKQTPQAALDAAAVSITDLLKKETW